jgi:hypothetical protein
MCSPRKCIRQPILQCALEYRAVAYSDHSSSTRLWTLTGTCVFCVLCLNLLQLVCWHTCNDLCRMEPLYIQEDFPHDTSGPHVISDRYPNHHACEQIWPPNMDINPCNIFIWDFKYCCAVTATKHVSHNMTLQYNLIPKNSAKVLRAIAIQLQVRVYITRVLPSDHTHTRHSSFRNCTAKWQSYWTCTPPRINPHVLVLVYMQICIIKR